MSATFFYPTFTNVFFIFYPRFSTFLTFFFKFSSQRLLHLWSSSRVETAAVEVRCGHAPLHYATPACKGAYTANVTNWNEMNCQFLRFLQSVQRNWTGISVQFSSVAFFKPHSARTGRAVFSQLSAAVVRHKANGGVVYAIRAWFKYDAALSAVV